MTPQTPTAPATPVNGESAAQDLFALTDEQILEIEPAEASPASVGQPFLAVQAQTAETTTDKSSDAPSAAPPQKTPSQGSMQNAQPGMAVPQEPPEWLARQMKDPWAGDEAREFWEGVQRAQSEAAAYRAAFTTPAEAAAIKEDARALKELYPGGVTEARAAAERARVLDEIDRAYFGAQGAAPAETSASRAQLAARMMQEDPAAFREMVVAGLQALQDAEKGSVSNEPRLARVLASNESAPPRDDAGLKPSATGAAEGAAQNAPQQRPDTEALARYTAFERAANEDLEKSVGGAIARTIENALPAARQIQDPSTAGARNTVPLHERLAAAVRADVEAALKNDRQLGEQVAQVLSARRFDDDSRAQVVRLINDRARQLVPVAAKRALSEWTQTAFAMHRGKTQKTYAGQRADLALDVAQGLPAQSGFSPEGVGGQRQRPENAAGLKARATAASQWVDYQKLSDEQILNL